MRDQLPPTLCAPSPLETAAVQLAGGEIIGQTAWIFSDGKAGHEVQCLGVAQALGLSAEVKRVSPGRLVKLTAPWGPVSRSEGFGRQGSTFSPPWPAFAFAAGRLTIPYIRALKHQAKLATYTIILLDPKTPASSADLMWVPQHDKRRGPNVVTTLTSPHGFSAARLAALRAGRPAEIEALPGVRIAVLLGGPNGEYRFEPADAERLGRALRSLAAKGASLMISPSRRTPPAFLAVIDAATSEMPRLLYRGEGANPYADFLANADAFVVTADSVNMAGEAAATGKPIYVFEPTGGGPKFTRFHEGLRAYGATRLLPDNGCDFLQWTYIPLDSAIVIADEIQRRWRIRCQMLPGLVSR
jgi:mitochondrial fission protein ELM1